VTGRTARHCFAIALLAALALPDATPATSACEATARGPAVRIAQEAPAAPHPTAHPPLPSRVADYWLVPAPGWPAARADAVSAARALAQAARLIDEEKYTQALSYIRPAALASTPLAGYAAYLTGLAQLELDRLETAGRIFQALRASSPAGYLAEAATLQLAEISTTGRDYATAVALYDDVLALKPATPDDVLLRLARAAASAGDRGRSHDAYQTLYFDWPTSEAAASAEDEMPLAALGPIAAGTPRFARELARAERLFAERRYAPAREAFEQLASAAAGDEAELVQLRMAESDYFLKRFSRVREDLSPFLDRAARRAEARFFYLMTTQRAGSRDQYIEQTRALVGDFPDSSWAEDALNNLASFHIVADEDDQADVVFREIISRFPSGRYTARAMWKVGWRAYRQKHYAEAAEVFERAAVIFPRTDYRPSYLYWAAKAREQAGDATGAGAGFQLVHTDYANTYYGRLAAKALASNGTAVPGPGLVSAPPAEGGSDAPTADIIRWLIFVEMYDEALDEVRYAERAHGSSAQLAATRAWLLNKTGELRPGINLMRRTYPQFLAAGGESMPPDVLSVIFPLQYWPLIGKYAAAHGLDPYLVAALIAQESTFDKDVVSSAKAIGLMQIMPATGRRWARRLGIRSFSTRRLTVAETNVRIGTAYFADLLKQFGSDHAALAAYNAGESRVVRWQRERPGIPRDEFIDDIPFPETQNYVRRILGTAEDYRRLYGGRQKPAGLPKASPSRTAQPGAAAPKPVIIKK
jgi:soluble lytic murein transglycosylase